MAFTEKLVASKPKTAAEALDMWLGELPDDEKTAVVGALRNKGWSHKELKTLLEEDEDHPAPAFGMTAFREWRAGFLA